VAQTSIQFELYLRSFQALLVSLVAMTISIRRPDRQMDLDAGVPDVTANVGSARHSAQFES